MVVQVDYDDKKARLKDLIESAMRGEKVIIAKNGKQIAQIVPVKSAARRKFGSAKGKIKMSKNFDEPLGDFHEYLS
jgi:prevent-host-death family protein